MVDFNYQHIWWVVKTTGFQNHQQLRIFFHESHPIKFVRSWGLTGHNGAWTLRFLDLDEAMNYTRLKINGFWTNKKWWFGSDDFPDFNWVFFWFNMLILQGV